MIEFIVQYWLEILFGLIVTGGSIFIKRFWKLQLASLQNDKVKNQEEILEKINTLMKDEHNSLLSIIEKNREDQLASDARIQDSMQTMHNDMLVMNKGILSIQGLSFKRHCRNFLYGVTELNQQNWEELTTEYNTYTDLGGNGDGKIAYELVKVKYEKLISE